MRRTTKTEIRRDEARVKALGSRVRRLRLQQVRTQKEIAKACGFTKSMLCKIESGAAYPSVAALVRLASVLGTNMAALMEENVSGRPVFVTRAQAEASVTKSEKGYAVFPYATEVADKKMQPFLFVVRKGEVKRHTLSHPGEEFVCVLDGEILFTVGDTEFRMRPGDSLFFNSLDPHGVVPVTAVAKYLDVFI